MEKPPDLWPLDHRVSDAALVRAGAARLRRVEKCAIHHHSRLQAVPLHFIHVQPRGGAPQSTFVSGVDLKARVVRKHDSNDGPHRLLTVDALVRGSYAYESGIM